MIEFKRRTASSVDNASAGGDVLFLDPDGVYYTKSASGVLTVLGRGINSIVKTGTVGLVDTYTITFSGGATQEYEVTNGDDGRSIVGIAKTGTVGLVDTYTITYSEDPLTSTFTVVNGDDGRSIVSIARTTGDGSPGTTDVYTITYSEAPLTSTFSVYNGANGGVTQFNGRTGNITPQQSDYDTFFTTPSEAAAAAPVQSVSVGKGLIRTALAGAITLSTQDAEIFFHVKDYGTLTDGSDSATVSGAQADANSAAIAAALAFASSSAVKKPGGIVLLPPGTFHISSSLVLNTSSVILRGAGRRGNTDIGSQTGTGTTLFWNNTGSSATTAMIDVTSVQGAGNAAVKGAGVQDMNLQCAGNVGIGLRVKSIHWGDFRNLYIINATAKGLATECFITGTQLGEAADVTKCTFDNIGIRMLEVSNTAVGFSFGGASNANTSNSTFRNLAVSCQGSQLAVDVGNTDSNRFYDLTINQSNGGTVQPIRLRGGASAGLEARGNVFYYLAAGGSSTGTRGLYSEGTEIGGVSAPAKNNVVFGYSIENGEPLPIIGTGSALTYITCGGSGAAAFNLAAYNGQGPIRPPIAAPIITNPTTVAETIVARWEIPGGNIAQGFGAQLSAQVESGSTGTVIWRIRVGNLGTVADAAVLQTGTSAASAATQKAQFYGQIFAGTSTTVRGSGYGLLVSTIQGEVTAADVAATINPAASVFVSITCTVSVASAANLVRSAVLTRGGG